jgi:predicted DNA-binding transcriptional regulator AlpA
MDESINNQRRLLNARQAAAFLAISERKLWGLTQQGRIPAVKFDRVVRYDINDLNGFITAMKEAVQLEKI